VVFKLVKCCQHTYCLTVRKMQNSNYFQIDNFSSVYLMTAKLKLFCRLICLSGIGGPKQALFFDRSSRFKLCHEISIFLREILDRSCTWLDSRKNFIAVITGIIQTLWFSDNSFMSGPWSHVFVRYVLRYRTSKRRSFASNIMKRSPWLTMFC